MADISKIKALDGITYNVKDIIARQNIPFGIVDSTSTSTAFTATVPGITSLEDGTCMLLKNGVVTSASGFTININGLGAKPAYSNMAAATAETTIFNINYTMLFIYDSTRISGGAWILYRGYNSDTNTIEYQLRTNSTVLKTADQSRYYRLFFTSADGTHWVPANTQKDNSATSVKTVNQRKIDPFGRIIYYGASTNLSAESNLSAASCWDQYTFALGYSFNTTGAELTLTTNTPIYIKAAPQEDGSAIIDSTTPYVQALPSAVDGKIYIFLGVAYSATNIELTVNHPIYYHDGSGIKLWMGTNIRAEQLSRIDTIPYAPWYGSKISIIGDSMSTYAGYIYAGYSEIDTSAKYTYPKGDVDDVNKTWWKRIIEAIGGTLEVNASYSGARVTKNGNWPTLYRRTQVIGDPDIIFIALCYNDYQWNVSLGEYDFTTNYTSLSEDYFRTGLIKGIKALQATKPNAKIVYTVFHPAGLTDEEEAIFSTYLESIIYICNELQVQFLPVVKHTTLTSLSDEVHPDAYGMKTIANDILNPYLQRTGGSFYGKLSMRSMRIDLKNQIASSSTETQRVGNTINFEDINRNIVATIRSIQLKNNQFSGIDIVGQNLVNGSAVNNYLRLGVNSNGTKVVTVSDGAIWRTALGLGTAATRGVDTTPTVSSTDLITSGGVKTALDNKLSTSGGTIPSNVTFTVSHVASPSNTDESFWYTPNGSFGVQNGSIFLKSGNIDVTAPPSSGSTGTKNIGFVDKNGESIGYIYGFLRANGNRGLVLRNVGGSNGSVTNDLTFEVSTSGKRTITVSDSAIWRTALSLDETTITVTVPSTAPTGISTLASVYCYRAGHTVTVTFENLKLASTVPSSWATIATGLPAPTRTFYTEVDSGSATADNRIRVRVNTSGVLAVAYGTASKTYTGSFTYVIPTI